MYAATAIKSGRVIAWIMTVEVAGLKKKQALMGNNNLACFNLLSTPVLTIAMCWYKCSSLMVKNQ